MRILAEVVRVPSAPQPRLSPHSRSLFAAGASLDSRIFPCFPLPTHLSLTLVPPFTLPESKHKEFTAVCSFLEQSVHEGARDNASFLKDGDYYLEMGQFDNSLVIEEVG